MSYKAKHTLLIAAAIFFGLSALAGAQQAIGAYARYRRQASTPATPPAGFVLQYIRDSDGHIMTIDSSATTKDYGAAAGTVSSVALTLPSFISVAGSPITTSGTLAGTLATQTANTALWGPTTGSAAAPTFRTMVNADLATTNAVLQTDWFTSPVDEMANGLHDGVFASFANHTCGTRFMTQKAIHVTGVRFFWPGTVSKSVKVSLWNKAGSRLANGTVALTSTKGIQTVTFGSSVALSANLLYYVSGWITDGSLGLGYGVANTDLNISNSQVDVHYPGSAVITWTGWGADNGGGDTFPNGDNTNVICQFDPVYTVP